jgi:hypothetical protein
MLLKTILFFLLATVISGHNILEVKYQNERVSLIVKYVLEDLNFLETETHDVVLFRLNIHQNKNEEVDDTLQFLMKTIPKENVMLTPKWETKLNTFDLRQAAVVIIVLDYFDYVSEYLVIVAFNLFRNKIDFFMLDFKFWIH